MSYDEAVTKIPVFAVYHHFKGNYYEVLAIAKHSETNEPFVVYQDMHKRGFTWIRPASMWLEEIAPGVKRFERVKS